MPDLTLKPIHKFHANEASKQTWDLAVIDRTPQQNEEMLTAAHAAAYHWRHIGSAQHLARTSMLLAKVHALLGLGNTAWLYAEEMKAFFLNEPNIPDWEIAFTYAIHAHAASVAGHHEAHHESYLLAKAAIEAITDPEDRTIVQATFDLVPQPM